MHKAFSGRCISRRIMHLSYAAVMTYLILSSKRLMSGSDAAYIVALCLILMKYISCLDGLHLHLQKCVAYILLILQGSM